MLDTQRFETGHGLCNESKRDRDRERGDRGQKKGKFKDRNHIKCSEGKKSRVLISALITQSLDRRHSCDSTHWAPAGGVWEARSPAEEGPEQPPRARSRLRCAQGWGRPYGEQRAHVAGAAASCWVLIASGWCRMHCRIPRPCLHKVTSWPGTGWPGARMGHRDLKPLPDPCNMGFPFSIS